jgi:Mn2+/Fe2+ NRAMP family transporter
MMAIKNLPAENVEKTKEFKLLKRSFGILGPGLITGAADDDPSGISTYSVAGAAYGYATLWIALLTFPLMAAIQLMCARLGYGYAERAGGRGADVLSRWVLWGSGPFSSSLTSSASVLISAAWRRPRNSSRGLEH